MGWRTNSNGWGAARCWDGKFSRRRRRSHNSRGLGAPAVASAPRPRPRPLPGSFPKVATSGAIAGGLINDRSSMADQCAAINARVSTEQREQHSSRAVRPTGAVPAERPADGISAKWAPRVEWSLSRRLDLGGVKSCSLAALLALLSSGLFVVLLAFVASMMLMLSLSESAGVSRRAS